MASQPYRLVHFNTPAPCGAGPVSGLCFSAASCHFNPPAPCGAGHFAAAPIAQRSGISIHPPLAGRDPWASRVGTQRTYFNPPAPCGAGLGFPRPRSDATSFQSTRPLRGGTGGLLRESVARGISIHPPLAGRDLIHAAAVEKAMISIHPPLAGRDPYSLRRRCGFVISIHPPLAGRDQARARAELTLIISIHPPLAGRDCGVRGAGWLPGHFNPPAPCGAGL